MFNIKFWYYLPENTKKCCNKCVYSQIFWIVIGGVITYLSLHIFSFSLISIIQTSTIKNKLGQTPCEDYIFLNHFNVSCSYENSVLEAFVFTIVGVNGSLILGGIIGLIIQIFLIMICSFCDWFTMLIGLINIKYKEMLVQYINTQSFISDTCYSCLENKPNIKFIPCGHIASCKVCFDKQEKKECGICREVVVDVLDYAEI